jgi:Leucine-rich repeat (LRR) protein
MDVDIELKLINNITITVLFQDNMTKFKFNGGLIEIPKNIKLLTNIELLNLENNQISVVPAEIKYLDTLDTLLPYPRAVFLQYKKKR